MTREEKSYWFNNIPKEGVLCSCRKYMFAAKEEVVIVKYDGVLFYDINSNYYKFVFPINKEG